MADQVSIVGVAMTPFGVHSDRSVADLTRVAVTEALDDAEIALDEVGAFFFGNATQGALEGQIMIPGQVALRALGVRLAPVFNVENACATGSSALYLAVNHVRSGAADVALAVGVEKMNVADRARSMAVFDGAYDVSRPDRLHQQLEELGGAADTADVGNRSIFMDIYAAFARAHMAKFGSTQEQIAAVASKNHAHAALNPRAYFRKAMSVGEILGARPLAYPLTVPMCSPLTDGAAAVVVCSAERLRRSSPGRSVEVLSCTAGSGTERSLGDYENHITRLTGDRAYNAAGVGPADVDVAEVHDATAFGELLLTELLGLCSPGEGGYAAERGETSLGGRLPVNPSGGLESKGHPLGATGLGQVFELVTQLRGEAGPRQVDGARVALAENGGGYYGGEEAVAVVTALRR